MKTRHFSRIMMALSLMMAMTVYAQEIPAEKNWLHIYFKEGLHKFHAYPHKSVKNFEFSSSTSLEDSVYDTLHLTFSDNSGKLLVP